MTDRKKVIMSLSNTLRYCHNLYNHVTNEEQTWLAEINQGAKDAIALLKEQEPIAPKLIKMYPHDIYECGNCGHRSIGSKDYKAKYCPECGRKVQWGG